jgi:glutathione peroxidase-family protein
MQVVNVASECGFTDDHYTQLQKMYDILGHDDHFTILAFPCNQFGAQEPGTNEEILVNSNNFVAIQIVTVFFTTFLNPCVTFCLSK